MAYEPNSYAIVMTGDNEENVRKYAGQMRLTLANVLEEKGLFSVCSPFTLY